jgi:NAD(P)-dependent dehydrogenase (short-subunit alcohol dehydrogenase family)
VDLTGRKIGVVTGASRGIGKWIALGLARAGHHVVLVCRDPALGNAAAAWIDRLAPSASVEVRLADFRSLHAVHRLGQEIAATHPRIDLLVNNAGVFMAKREWTSEGRETVLAVNHLAPYVLTGALETALRASAPSRIVNIGSSTSDRTDIDPDDLELRHGWGMTRAYSRSKLALMMSTFALAERLRGSGVVANVVHPGAVATGLIRERGAIGIAWWLMGSFLRTEEQGADSPLHAALAPEWATMTGHYVKNRGIARPNPRALDPALVERVEAATRALVGETIGADGLGT